MADNFQEKSQQPTAKRRQDAKEQGQAPRSRELNTFFVLLGGTVSITFFSHSLFLSFADIMQRCFSPLTPHTMDASRIMLVFKQSGFDILIALAPIFIVLILCALLAPLLLGFRFNPHLITPNAERISIVKGFKRMFSLQGLTEVVKSLLKFSVIISAGMLFLYLKQADILYLSALPTELAIHSGMKTLLLGMIVISASLGIFATVDVPYQLWAHLRQLRMSVQEVRDETKNTEGSPEIKSMIRRQQSTMAYEAMLNVINTATVVIRDSDNVAIALTHQQMTDTAPRLVAKGRDSMAKKIVQRARTHRVPIISAAALARSIYTYTPVQQAIPSGLYVAVAHVLAHLKQQQHHHLATTVFSTEHLIPTELKHDDGQV